MTRRLRVQFAHGLESGPGSSKATYLAARFDATTPAMPTGDFEECVRIHASRIREAPPDVLVGSSFGGAVVLALLTRGLYRGPVVLLASAQRHFGVPERIPDGVAAVVVHGTRDDVVDPEGSRALARTGTPGKVELVIVDDEHRLASVLVGDTLERHVRRALELSLGVPGEP